MEPNKKPVLEQLIDFCENYEEDTVEEYTRCLILALVQSDTFEHTDRLDRCNIITYLFDIKDIFLTAKDDSLIQKRK